MNRKERRAADSQARTTGQIGDGDTAMSRFELFTADLQDVVHKVIERHSLRGDNPEVAVRLVQVMSTTAAGYAMVAGATRDHYVEAMTMYFDQVHAEYSNMVDKLDPKKQPPPSIIVKS